MTYHQSPLQLCPLPIQMIIYDFFLPSLSALTKHFETVFFFFSLNVIWGLKFLFLLKFLIETADMLFLNLVP